jgi:hypothetical protein
LILAILAKKQMLIAAYVLTVSLKKIRKQINQSFKRNNCLLTIEDLNSRD